MARAARPVIFGEVLFDLFEGGHAVIGGAPFNVAWHLHAFGMNPLFISRIGKDADGDRIFAFMKKFGMDQSGIQWDDAHPTGRVHVSLLKDDPTYHILPNRAYDFIDKTQAQKALAEGNWSLLYHGTLISRSERSSETLKSIATSLGLKTFLGLNIRPPWYDEDVVQDMLRGANWVKVSEKELDWLLGADTPVESMRVEGAKRLHRRYDLEILAVTVGAEGAFMIGSRKGMVTGRPVVAKEILDTVGAGDAFAAVAILGILNDWTLEQTVNRSIHFASDLCGWAGAVTRSTALHQARLRNWEGERFLHRGSLMAP
ncbi:MAG: carbohydrate kinase [Candidatus Thiodiazotropha sp. (ex Dulcina madagascariensis)]|nr:carbohydrate kinase [Candidatus Thiodiazotropha sp. (ex Dulcina madagascariensis)]MCU7925345.1 carbohydrate kinase [Candidatus Thiodiazotropha sp. (ex Dulcina madagascariensis)]